MSSPFFATAGAVAARIKRAPLLLACFDVERILPAADDDSTAASALLAEHLRALSALPALTVAVMSGRSRADLQARIGIPGLVYVGNLGLEISGDGFLFVEPTAAGFAEESSRLAARLAQKLAPIPGVQVQNKGLTIRIAPPQQAGAASEEVRRLLHETLAGANHPFHLASRDQVYEIRPRVAWTKADAIGWIKDRVRQPAALVVYVSDDDNTEDTVAALPDAVTIKVGGPAETLAAYRLEDVGEIWPFMNWLRDVGSSMM